MRSQVRDYFDNPEEGYPDPEEILREEVGLEPDYIEELVEWL